MSTIRLFHSGVVAGCEQDLQHVVSRRPGGNARTSEELRRLHATADIGARIISYTADNFKQFHSVNAARPKWKNRFKN
jgi:hypothetical protein